MKAWNIVSKCFQYCKSHFTLRLIFWGKNQDWGGCCCSCPEEGLLPFSQWTTWWLKRKTPKCWEGAQIPWAESTETVRHDIHSIAPSSICRNGEETRDRATQLSLIIKLGRDGKFYVLLRCPFCVRVCLHCQKKKKTNLRMPSYHERSHWNIK